MTNEAFSRAREIEDAIADLQRLRGKIESGEVYRKSCPNIAKEILEEGETAMMALIDQRIEAQRQEFAKL